MASKVETMVSGMNETPWHGLGAVVAGALTADQALKLGGLNWQVKKVPIWVPGYKYDGGDVRLRDLRQATDGYAVVRDKDDAILGHVGGKYHVFQNHEAFAFFDQLVTRKEAMYHTAGVLDGGKIVWVLAKLPGDIAIKRRGHEDDITERFILLWWSHNGRAGFTAKFTMIRVVCANTLSMAMKGAGIARSIPHTANIQTQVAAMAEEMGLVNKRTAEFKEVAQAMMKTPVKKEADAVDFLRRCFDVGFNPDHQSEESAIADAAEGNHKLPRAVSNGMRLFEEGRGHELAHGTAWGLYNAAVEQVDHEANYRSADARLRNAWFEGSLHQAKLRAYSEAVKLIKV